MKDVDLEYRYIYTSRILNKTFYFKWKKAKSIWNPPKWSGLSIQFRATYPMGDDFLNGYLVMKAAKDD